MSRLLVLVLAALPSIAHAEPETIEREFRDLVLPEEVSDDHGFHAAAFAQLAGGSTDRVAETSLGTGGELRYRGDRCDYVRAGGQARLGTRTSAEQWASVCIPISVMEIGHHLEWDVRPSLLAPLLLRAGANRRETVSFHWQPLRARLPALLESVTRGEAKKEGVAPPAPMSDAERASLPQGDAIVFDVRVEATTLWGPMQTLASRERAETIPFGYVRRHVASWGEDRDFAVDLFSGGGDFVDRGAIVHVWFLRLENLALGPLYATGGIGIASADAGDFLPATTDHPYPGRALEVTSPRAELALETGGTQLRGHLRATRDVAIVPDGYITVDSRITTGLVVPLGHTRLTLDGAIARTAITVPGSRTVKAATGGGSLALAHHLASHLDATLQLDVARSFYAANVVALDFAPRWGVDAFAALQARVGR